MTQPKSFQEAVTYAVSHETFIIATKVAESIRVGELNLELLDEMTEELVAMIRHLIDATKFQLVVSGMNWEG